MSAGLPGRALRIAVWISYAAVLYLVSTEIAGPWVTLPGLGNIGFTLVFVLFSALHCAACAGWKKTLLFFALAGIISYAMEETGVRTGLVYGPYHYSGMLGPKLGHVPVIIPLAWFMMIYPSWMVARALLQGLDSRSLVGLISLSVIAAMVMTAWDTVMDPGMAAAGNWIWERGGSWFGVPLHNYFGWLLTTFLVYLGAGFLWRNPRGLAHPPKPFAALPVIVYAAYSLSYIVPRDRRALQLVALFAMGLPSLLALMRLGLSEPSAAIK